MLTRPFRQRVGLAHPDPLHDSEQQHPRNADAPPGDHIGGEMRTKGDSGVADDDHAGIVGTISTRRPAREKTGQNTSNRMVATAAAPAVCPLGYESLYISIVPS
jgi:hypothetical protein